MPKDPLAANTQANESSLVWMRALSNPWIGFLLAVMVIGLDQ